MVIHKKDADIKGHPMTFRPDIKVLDCTVRDGSLCTSGHFEDDFVKSVYETCIAAGVDYMEIGYKASEKFVSREEFGIWKFSTEEDMRRIVGDNPSDLKLSVMADVGRTDYENDILPRDESVLDMIRVATYIHQIPTAMDIIKDAHDKGYETCANLMAVSTVSDKEIEEGLKILADSPVDIIYLVDSFGSLYYEPIRDLTLTYLEAIKGTGKKIGVHCHNNQQLAFANTITALTLGVSYLDATISGLGRGAGNCPMELLLGFLKNPKFHLRPVLQCLEEVFVPLKETVDWGYAIPYMLTGQFNEHPRSAIKAMDSDELRDKYLDFYDQMEDN